MNHSYLTTGDLSKYKIGNNSKKESFINTGCIQSLAAGCCCDTNFSYRQQYFIEMKTERDCFTIFNKVSFTGCTIKM